MDTINRSLWLLFLFLYTPLPHSYALQTPSEEIVLVGHISHIEGELLRYVPEDEDWVVAVEDAPAGIDDILYTGKNAKAELIMPNNTWIRIGENTQMHIIRLDTHVTEIDIDSGIARLYNKSDTVTITATTPLGSITAPPSSICDLFLEDDSIQVSALEGSVDFLHVTDSKHYGVTAGSSSLRAGYQEVASLNDIVDAGWDSWNRERDNLWEKRFAEQEDSSDYLPEELQYESYALKENGIWENVYYEGRNRSFWRPRYVSSSWSPFTVGRWTAWYGDQCWIPYEPFGYITHHYGNWVHINSCNRWYWAPPRCHRGGSYLNIGFGWYPGRVSWIHRGGYVGWIPLAPFERYYTRSHWGPRSHVVHTGGLGIVAFDTQHCRYNKHAIVVKKHNFYNGTNYNSLRVRGLRDTIINNYQRTAFVNSRVIKRFKEMPQRFTFGRGKGHRKPPLTVTKRIQRKKSRERPLLGRKRSTSKKKTSKVRSAKHFKRSSRKAPGSSQKLFTAKKGARRKTIRNPKQTTRKPRLNLQKKQTRIRAKGTKVAKRNPGRRTLKTRTLPYRKKPGSLSRSSTRTKRSVRLNGRQQQRSGRRSLVKAQRLKARPRLSARNLSRR